MRLRAAVMSAIVCLVVGVGPTAADEKDDAVKKDLAALAGTWVPVSVEIDGRKLGDEELKGVAVTYGASGKISVRRGDKVIGEGTFKIDPGKKPKAIDYKQTSEGEDKGKTALGIYEVEGDTLKLCTVPEGKERPAEFSSKPGSGHYLRVYKREKK
jgi:uncharacterized protein (TIGR03067 family)